MTAPTFAVLAGIGVPEGAAELAAFAAQSARFVPADQVDPACPLDAVIVVAFDRSPPPARRAAAWVRSAADAEAVTRLQAYPRRVLAIAEDPDLIEDLLCERVAAPLGPALTGGDEDGAEDGAVSILAFTRSLIRRAHGLSDGLVVDTRSWTVAGCEVPPELRATVLATCAAAIVGELGPAVRAARWGAPMVCSPEVHAALGAPVGIPTGGPDDLAELAAGLARDIPAAAVSGRLAGDWLRTRTGYVATWARVVRWLGLAPARQPGLAELDDLNTLPTATIRLRRAAAMRDFMLVDAADGGPQFERRQ